MVLLQSDHVDLLYLPLSGEYTVCYIKTRRPLFELSVCLKQLVDTCIW